MLSNKYTSLSLLAALFLSISCERSTPHWGTVGHYYSIHVDKPAGVKTPSYGWDILAFPDESLLSYTDLHIRGGGREMAFQPDAPGEYLFELIVFNSDGEAVITSKYHFKISGSAEAPTTEIVADAPAPSVGVVEDEAPVPDQPVEPTPERPKEETKPPVTAPTPNEEAAEPVAKEAPLPQKPPKSEAIAPVEGRFTLQVYSEPSLREAEERTNSLRMLGFDAYIQKAYFEETDELWYRVRVGAYNSRTEAQQAVQEIKRKTNIVAWVDKVRVDQ